MKVKLDRKILNFKNEQMYEVRPDGSKNYWTVGKLLCDMLLMARLEPNDDPLDVYKLAKRFYHEKSIELAENKAKEIYEFVKRSDFQTIMKGQILEELYVKPEDCKDCKKSTKDKPKTLK